MTRLLRVLGSIDLSNEDGSVAMSVLSQPKRVALLCYLAIARPTGFHRRSTLVGLFWPESDESRARNSLRQSLHFLRRSLGPDLLVCRGAEEVSIAPSGLQVDLIELDAALASGAVEAAMRLYRGPVMDGFHLSGASVDFERWLEAERAAVGRRLWQACCTASRTASERGALEEALRLAESAARLRPLHEKTLREVLRLQMRLGEPGVARVTYEAFATARRETLGTEPSEETRDVIEWSPASDGPRSESDESGVRIGAATEARLAPRSPAGTHALSEATEDDVPDVGSARWTSTKSSGRRPDRLAPIAIAAAAALTFVLPWGSSQGSSTVPEREFVVVSTPAVLPDREDERDLARGVQEEIVAALQATGLHLIPPGAIRSAERNGFTGERLVGEFEARYEVATSIQTVSGGYRVSVALTDWGDMHVGGTTVFDVPSLDLLDLRAEVATRVTGVLAGSAPGVALAHVGASQEVMPRYLEAVGLIGLGGTEAERFARWSLAERHLEEVLGEAPGFASAWATLALLRFRMFWLGADPSTAGVARGQAALDSAIRFDPDGLETRLATAYHAYHITRDWRAATTLARALSEDLDQNGDVALVWAMSERRRGDFQGAAAILEDRLARHPEELASYGIELVGTYRRLGREADARRILDLLVERRGACAFGYGEIWRDQGAGAALDEHVAACNPAGLRGPPAFWHEYRMRRPRAALAAVDSIEASRAREGLQAGWMSQQWAPFPLDFWRGRAFELLGDTAAARAAFARHIPELRRLVDELPEDFLRRRFLVMAHAGSGQRAEAMREATETIRIAEAGGDLWAGVPLARLTLMEAHMVLGETEAAVDLLVELQTDEVVPAIPPAQLATDPLYDGLRASPRFADLLGEPR